ncbi:hypothetical protein E2R23_04960 [Burkholderia pseudomallei]|nr:hypothetical protein EXY28_04945 [Burkholderia pseudomallei]QBI45974.1 hypothetical protein EXY72_04975 [Burkholderia pseudomallei]QBL83928.1 hypothetical protein EYA88_04960 [Burkholderia pseudomallei]QBP54381.1 hypothetical protein E2R23_04960 [Burkholderia pseudomallei]
MVGLARPFGGALRRRPVSKPAQHAGFFFALRALSGNVGRLVGDPRMRRRLERRRAERNRDFRPGTRISSGWKRSLPAYLAGTTCAKYLMPFGQAPGWRANPSLTFQSRRLTAPA